MKNKGITLIALVITIVLLIILAIVSINIVIGEDGIIGNAEETIKLQKLEEEKERLELVKATVVIKNRGKLPLDKYVDQLIEEGITTEAEVTTNEDGSKQVITDNGYVANIKQDGETNVIITIDGKVGELPVKILKVQLTPSTNSIKVEIEAERADGATYKIYYKTEDGDYGEAVYDGKESSYTITELEQKVTYTVKVEAINIHGTATKEEVARTDAVATAVGAISFRDLEWEDGQANVTVTKITEENIQMQYNIVDSKGKVVKGYTVIESGETISDINLGETVNVRLWDGKNGGNPASITVDDTVNPNEAEISFSSTSTNTVSSITATVSQSDGQSGVDISSCKWVYNTNPEKEIDESDYTEPFTSETQELPLSTTTEGTYYLHVLTVDMAGNKTQTVSKAGIDVVVSVTGVSLNKTTATITTAQTLQLSATITPSNATNQNVTWSSSDTSIAKVSTSGLVTPVTGGTVTITATTADGEKTATCKVTVTVPVTGVSLNKTTATITTAQTLQLTATVAPSNATNKSVTWSSSDTSIAKVSTSGLVTPVTGGTVTITATTADGEKTETCKVTVTVPVTGVSLNKTTATITTAQTLQLTATVAPSNATNKSVTWKSSNTSVATVSTSGLVTPVTTGTTTITVTTADGAKTATCKVTVTIPTAGTTVTKPSTWTSSGVTAIADGNGGKVPLPSGFSYSTGNYSSGIVITDGTNQFVWVPVNDTSYAKMYTYSSSAISLCGSAGVTTNYYSNLRARSEDSAYTSSKPGNSGGGSAREPDLVADYDQSSTYYGNAGFSSAKAMATEFVNDYKNMRDSIAEYDGFYIGRYELTGSVASPTVKAGKVLTAETAGNWYYLYKACKNVKNNSYVTTTMIWGCQWDETMNWLKNTKFKSDTSKVDTNSSSWGNYSDSSGNAAVTGYGSLQNTGFSSNWSANNIYDLAGNYWEWTQEALETNFRVVRGGNYTLTGASGAASDRQYAGPIYGSAKSSTRVVLYID